jgi:release factor glutamine methyltransferase
MSANLSITNNVWLDQAVKDLQGAGIATARLDCLVLLEDETGKDRAWLLAHPEFVLTHAQVKRLNTKIVQRQSHLPLAYIRGFTEFYGRQFVVSPVVLEPRPESETMIDLLQGLPILNSSPDSSGKTIEPTGKIKDSTDVTIADVGAGSGALGITAKLLFPQARVDLLELDPAAIKIAKINVIKYTTKINVVKSDLLSQAPVDYDILLCNLPYVPDNFHINPAAMAEPKIAIFGGADGLDIYRRLFDQIQKKARRPLYILCESLPPQHESLSTIAESAHYRLIKAEDFIQVFTRS